jgi:energy-coupling factor transport system ATP-binding protein
MIEITNLTFSYEVTAPPVLSEINLTVAEGEWLAIIGRNGSGKSTLARQMNGLLLPTGGRVTVDGADTADPAQLWQAREKVSFVFQNPDNQFIACTVEDDIAFGPENLGLPAEEIGARVARALDLMHLEEKKDNAPHFLSGGEKQRVAIAGALAMASRYLVLDEPTSMLDPMMRQTVIERLRFLHRELGMGIVYVTNIMEEALLAERVIVLDQGCIVREGSPAEIFADAQGLLDLGLDMPQISRLAAMLTKAGYGQFRGVMDSETLMEKLLCTK